MSVVLEFVEACSTLVNTQAFNGWLKSSNNMKLSSDALVLCITHEGITSFASLSAFDKKSIYCLANIYKNVIPDIDADASNNIISACAVARVSMPSVLVSSLITASNDAK